MSLGCEEVSCGFPILGRHSFHSRQVILFGYKIELHSFLPDRFFTSNLQLLATHLQALFRIFSFGERLSWCLSQSGSGGFTPTCLEFSMGPWVRKPAKATPTLETGGASLHAEEDLSLGLGVFWCQGCLVPPAGA